MGSITPLNFREGGLQGGEPWRRAVAGGGGCGGVVAGLNGGPELGEKGEGTKGVLSPTLARAGVQRGGGSAVAGVLEAAAMVVAVLGGWRGS